MAKFKKATSYFDVAAEKAAYAERVSQIAAAEVEATDAAAVAHLDRPI